MLLFGYCRKGMVMQQFVELKQDTEFLFALIVAVLISGWVGYQIGEWEKRGFDKIVRFDISYRFIWLFRKVANW